MEEKNRNLKKEINFKDIIEKIDIDDPTTMMMIGSGTADPVMLMMVLDKMREKDEEKRKMKSEYNLLKELILNIICKHHDEITIDDLLLEIPENKDRKLVKDVLSLLFDESYAKVIIKPILQAFEVKEEITETTPATDGVTNDGGTEKESVEEQTKNGEEPKKEEVELSPEDIIPDDTDN